MIYKHFVVITHVLTFTGKGDTPKRYTCVHFILKYIYILDMHIYIYNYIGTCQPCSTWGNMRKPFQRQWRSSISYPIAPCQASSVHEPVRNVRCVDLGMMGKKNGEGFLEDNDMHFHGMIIWYPPTQKKKCVCFENHSIWTHLAFKTETFLSSTATFNSLPHLLRFSSHMPRPAGHKKTVGIWLQGGPKKSSYKIGSNNSSY